MRVELSAFAEDDLTRVAEFNVMRGERCAEQVQERLLERCERLAITPEIGRPIKPVGTRRLSVTDIQYVIDYRVSKAGIEILRFQHSREIR